RSRGGQNRPWSAPCTPSPAGDGRTPNVHAAAPNESTATPPRIAATRYFVRMASTSDDAQPRAQIARSECASDVPFASKKIAPPAASTPAPRKIQGNGDAARPSVVVGGVGVGVAAAGVASVTASTRFFSPIRTTTRSSTAGAPAASYLNT